VTNLVRSPHVYPLHDPPLLTPSFSRTPAHRSAHSIFGPLRSHALIRTNKENVDYKISLCLIVGTVTICIYSMKKLSVVSH